MNGIRSRHFFMAILFALWRLLNWKLPKEILAHAIHGAAINSEHHFVHLIYDFSLPFTCTSDSVGQGHAVIVMVMYVNTESSVWCTVLHISFDYSTVKWGKNVYFSLSLSLFEMPGLWSLSHGFSSSRPTLLSGLKWLGLSGIDIKSLNRISRSSEWFRN